MIVKFLDMEDEKNPLSGTDVDNSRTLLDILESAKKRMPFFCELVGETGTILIGVGEPGCVQNTSSDGDPPYLMAVSPAGEYREGDFEFLAGGTATPVSSRYCLPFDLIKKLAVEFQQSGFRSSAVEWEEI